MATKRKTAEDTAKTNFNLKSIPTETIRVTLMNQEKGKLDSIVDYLQKKAQEQVTINPVLIHLGKNQMVVDIIISGEADACKIVSKEMLARLNS